MLGGVMELGCISSASGTVWRCYAICLPEDARVDDGYEIKGLRELFGRIDEEEFWLAGRAFRSWTGPQPPFLRALRDAHPRIPRPRSAPSSAPPAAT